MQKKDYQKRLPVVQTYSMCQVASVCRISAYNDLPLWFGLPANVGIGIVSPVCLSSLGNRVSDPVSCGTDPRSLCGAQD